MYYQSPELAARGFVLAAFEKIVFNLIEYAYLQLKAFI